MTWSRVNLSCQSRHRKSKPIFTWVWLENDAWFVDSSLWSFNHRWFVFIFLLFPCRSWTLRGTNCMRKKTHRRENLLLVWKSTKWSRSASRQSLTPVSRASTFQKEFCVCSLCWCAVRHVRVRAGAHLALHCVRRSLCALTSQTLHSMAATSTIGGSAQPSSLCHSQNAQPEYHKFTICFDFPAYGRPPPPPREISFLIRHGVEAKNYEDVSGSWYCWSENCTVVKNEEGFLTELLFHVILQIAKAEKLKPMEAELRRLEDLSDAIVESFNHMRKREDEMRGTNGKAEVFSRKLFGILTIDFSCLQNKPAAEYYTSASFPCCVCWV